MKKKEIIEYIEYAIEHGTTAPVMFQNLSEMFSEAFNQSISPMNAKIPSKFKRAKENKWEQPIMNGYLMKCCDCGLVHEVDFRIAYGKKEEDNRVQLRMRRFPNVSIAFYKKG